MKKFIFYYKNSKLMNLPLLKVKKKYTTKIFEKS